MASLGPSGRRRGHTRTAGGVSTAARLLALACVCAALGLSLQTFTQHALASGRPPGGRIGDPVVRAVDIAQPSIVRIAAIYTAHITLTLCGQNITLPSGSEGYTLGATGTGTFISANGDILTADHVVDVPKDLLDQAIFQEPSSASDIANLLTTNPGCHASQAITADDVAAGYVQYAGIPYAVHYSAPRRLVWQSTAYTGGVSNTPQNDPLAGLMAAPYHDATVLSASSVNDNDLAIVHVDLSDTPNVQLDNSASVAVDDPLTIIGYPGNGDVSNDSTDLLTPSVNDITISAIKSGDNGAELIQVGGNVEHGDSGGPALDAQGHIVGIVSFAFVGPDSPGSTAFLRSSNSVQSLISAAGITTAPGAFERAWETAFADYSASYAGHWHVAARELDDLYNHYPEFKGIQPYQAYADQAASTEVTTADPAQVREIAGGTVALLALMLAALAAALLMRGRRKRKHVYTAATQPLQSGATFPYGSYGYPPAAYGPAPGQFFTNGRPYGYTVMGGQRPPLSPALPHGWAEPAGAGTFAPPAMQAGPPSAGMFGGYGGAPTDAPLDASMGRMSPDPLMSAPRTSVPSGDSFASGAAQRRSTGNPHPLEAGQVGAGADGAGSSAWRVSGFGSPPAHTRAAPAPQYFCGNGHAMSPGEQRCARCGAPRWAGPPSMDESVPGRW